MAIYYFKKDFCFFASFEVKYKFICVYCGKEVEKTQRESCGEKHEQRVGASYNAKVAPEIKVPEDIAYRYKLRVRAAAQHKLDAFRRKNKSGDFSFLHDTECTYCRKPQPWEFSRSRAAGFIILGILIIPASLVIEYLMFTSQTMLNDLGPLVTWFIRIVWLICPLIGLGLISKGRSELRRVRKTRTDADRTKLPVVFLPDNIEY